MLLNRGCDGILFGDWNHTRVGDIHLTGDLICAHRVEFVHEALVVLGGVVCEQFLAFLQVGLLLLQVHLQVVDLVRVQLLVLHHVGAGLERPDHVRVPRALVDHGLLLLHHQLLPLQLHQFLLPHLHQLHLLHRPVLVPSHVLRHRVLLKIVNLALQDLHTLAASLNLII